MVTYSGDLEDQPPFSPAVQSQNIAAPPNALMRQVAGEFEVISFWGILLLVCGGLMVFRHLFLPGWLDTMVMADMLLQGWIGENSVLSEQFIILQAVEPGQLPYLMLAGIDAVVGPLDAPVVAAILCLVLLSLALHALVHVSGHRRTAPALPMSILALSLLSGLVLHRYPPAVLYGLTFSLAAIAVWRHRFTDPDIAGTVLLTLALTMTLGMDFQIFLGTIIILGLVALGEGLTEISRLGRKPALAKTALRLLMLFVALIPAALMLTYFTRVHDPDWGAILTAITPSPVQTSLLPTDILTLPQAVSAFPQSAEPWLILGLAGVTGLLVLMGILFRPFRGRMNQADMLLVAGALMVTLALTVFRDTLFSTSGPITGGKAFWLGLILLIVWSALSPIARPVRYFLMAASVLITAALTGNRVLSYEHLTQQNSSTGAISGLVKKGSVVIGLDFTGGDTARRVAGLSILQQSAIDVSIPALSDSPAVRILESNPPLEARPGRELAQLIGTNLRGDPLSVRLSAYHEITGSHVGSLFVRGAPPSTPSGSRFSKFLKASFEPVYKFTSGSLKGLTLYQPRPWPQNDIGGKTQ